MKPCKPSCCSARESCDVVLLRLRRLIACSLSNRRVVSNVAFCYVTMKPDGQKNDVCCEYTRGAPEPLLLQIPIDT